ncbi:MAG: helix-turn-helix transcriptional regulator [Firmicutes bacterium]|nr:helix-turn-helix transcriptional regulator [Bacillota bacterium]
MINSERGFHLKIYAKIINLAEDYIEKNLNKNILLSDIANSVHLSEYHFHRIFRAWSSETIHQFISRIKLERSAILLVTNQNLSITDIAMQYGYSETSSYCRAFKKHFKITPMQFRLARIVKTYEHF